jgi:4-amino-4-deoxy-L-arabinose transferase-like glycosyltransferase
VGRATALARSASGGALLVAAAGVALLGWGLGLGFLDPDEGLYADVAARMLARRDPVLPRFNDLPYLEKPPLYFWLAALGLAAGLPAEWALRGVSALSALATAVVCQALGRRLWGAEAGTLAGLMWLTMVGTALYVRKASADLLFVACLSLALWGFVRDADRPPGRWRWAWLYVGAALGLLSKGLLGLVLPALIVGPSAWLAGAPRLRDLKLGRGLLLVALLAGPWHLAAALRAPDLFWFYVVDNQLLRFLGRRGVVEDDVPVSTAAFLALTFLWSYPWSVFALARPAAPPAPGSRWQALPAVWALTVVGFFALARLKLEYYGLPAAPAVALLAGAAWASGRGPGRWLVAGGAGSALAAALALRAGRHLGPAAALDVLAELNVYYRILRAQGRPFPFDSAAPFGRVLEVLGIVLLAGWLAAVVSWARGRRRAAFAALALVGVGLLAVVLRVLTLVEPHHSSRALAAVLRARAGPEAVVVHEGSLEYSAALPFYLGRPVVVLDGTRGDLEMASRRPEARGWFIDRAELLERWRGPAPVFLVTREPLERSAVAALPPERVSLVGRFGGRAVYTNRSRP